MNWWIKRIHRNKRKYKTEFYDWFLAVQPTTPDVASSSIFWRQSRYSGQIKSFNNNIFATRGTPCLDFILVCFHQPPSAPSIFCFLTDLAWLTIYRGCCRGSVKTQVGLSALCVIILHIMIAHGIHHGSKEDQDPDNCIFFHTKWRFSGECGIVEILQ